MKFTTEGVPTHATYEESWEHRKKGIIVKTCAITGITGGRNAAKVLSPGDEVWVLMYVSELLIRKKPIYVIRPINKSFDFVTYVPADVVKVQQE